MSTKFYIKDEKGRYLSTDGLTKYTCLRGRALYEFLQSEEGKKRCFHVDVDENGDKIGIEADPEVMGEFEAEDRRTRYLRDVEVECNVKIISANVMVYLPSEEEVELQDTIASDCDVELEVQSSLNLQSLRKALSCLTESEYGLIYALYLSEEPLTERQYAIVKGLAPMTVHNRKKRILQKLQKII